MAGRWPLVSFFLYYLAGYLTLYLGGNYWMDCRLGGVADGWVVYSMNLDKLIDWKRWVA